MPSDLRAIVHRWFEEVWNQGREETVDELLAPDAIGYSLADGQDVVGPKGFKPFLRNMRGAFPDVHVRVHDTFVDGTKAAAHISLEATHLGDQLGVPKTGRRVKIGGVILLRIDNGRVVEAWNYWDQLGLMRQLGAVPEHGPHNFLAEA
jgi:steroid delta-isomerase-like uncharacterized protein